MYISLSSKKPQEKYFILTQMIIPRPIAWVLSRPTEQGTLNLAPFSFFAPVSGDPPMLMFSVGMKNAQEPKDTWYNIERFPYFVVHIPQVEQIDQVNRSSESFERSVSEIDQLQLKTSDWEKPFPVPRLLVSPIAMACERSMLIPIQNSQQMLIFGEIKDLWVDDHCINSGGKHFEISSQALDPLSRLGAREYAALGKRLYLDRPR